jgi:hypothetical protein
MRDDARMRPRIVALLVLAAAVPWAGAARAEPSPSQKLFTQSLLDDPGTSASVKRLLSTHQGIVDPRSGFVDVTGDGRQDALVLVTTGGAAGTVGLYVFSTHGQPAAGGDQTKLKVLFRLQSLYRATLRVSGTTISVLEPRYRSGDDLCCPQKLRERDYAFDAKRVTFRRVADHEVPFTTR